MFSKSKPASTAIPVRDTLFGDLPLDYWAAAGNDEEPWNLFRQTKKYVDAGKNTEAIKILKEITNLPNLESRQYLQAFHFLKNLGAQPTEAIKIFGVVVEVAIEGGADLLAIYADRSARYYNYAGSAIIWEHPNNLLDNKIDSVFIQAKDVVAKIGPWEEPRPAVPGKGMARLNFLTSHGLHFGQAQQSVLFNDPMAGKIMYALLDIMQTLMDFSNKKAEK